MSDRYLGRLIIQLHVVCFAASFQEHWMLDQFPHHLWSDFMSIQGVVNMVHDYIVQSRQLGYDSGYTVEGNMADCVWHLPCPDGAFMWAALSAWQRDRKVSASLKKALTAKGARA